ncbi:Ger(x)C family spore germination protein [Virgibacillus halophilus]|uniref:Ger(X)C family spore germination protein n=1 Tax=Tigheibacillus halophilus TaxID=361280 RepID=A0ABU5C9D1_9BACI|nr:Ger(x)C family spore germination protein [Virgibacillus halophilus]
MLKKLFCFISLICLCGCIPTQQLEHLGIIYAGGIDKTDDDKLLLTAVINQFESQSKNKTKIVTGEAKTLKSAVENANLETNFQLTTGKVQLDLFGLETAKRGIGSFIDALARDSTIPDTMYLAVSQTPARDLITIQNKAISVNTGQFLHDVIERNSSDHLFPIVTLVKFQSSMFDVGRDPILPLFELQGNIPKMTGIAIFKDDRYVGKLSMNDKYLFNLLEKRIKEERFEASISAKALKKNHTLTDEPR